MSTRTLAIALALAVCQALPAAAQADSIAYIKSGDVWLANGDGTGQVQVTRGGYAAATTRSAAPRATTRSPAAPGPTRCSETRAWTR